MKKQTMLLLAIVAMLCSLLLAPSTPIWSSRVKRRGTIEGSVTQKGREGTIMVIGFTHAFTTEPDPRSCLTGEIRSHSPLTIIKTFDKATNPLFQAWATREPLSVVLDFWRPSATGIQGPVFYHHPRKRLHFRHPPGNLQ